MNPIIKMSPEALAKMTREGITSAMVRDMVRDGYIERYGLCAMQRTGRVGVFAIEEIHKMLDQIIDGIDNLKEVLPDPPKE